MAEYNGGEESWLSIMEERRACQDHMRYAVKNLWAGLRQEEKMKVSPLQKIAAIKILSSLRSVADVQKLGLPKKTEQFLVDFWVMTESLKIP